jgi:hypothetical protein
MEGGFIRFGLDAKYLSVEVLVVGEFRYYFRRYEVDDSGGEDKVPGVVVDKGLASRFQ